MVGPLGTLIVVVLKARNLPNKQRIGKQDPYATCTYLSHRKRTKTDKRGGQHPVWDDELRFDIYEHAKDAMASASVSTTATGGVVPVKTPHPPIGSVGSAGFRDLRVAVYADDPRDPDLIGEGKVDLTDTLKKGEFDDWVTINNKGKYQGEVYLEMTFYSAKPPPEKLMTPTGPARAGVFEASSPHSVLRTAQQQPAKAGARNGTHSPSPAVTPSKKAEAWSLPPALRTGAPAPKPAHPRPSIGTLPLPGEPATVQHPAIASRQRSTGSLSMPTADHPAHLSGSPSPSPSRNHQPYERPAPLVTALDKLSISTQPNPHDQRSSHGSPAELHAPYHPSHGRPHRHSFSGHSHLPPPNLLHHSHSASPPIHDPLEPPDTHHQHPYPEHYPPATQPAPRPPITPRRPLPIPGGDSINRPTSAWGDYPPPPHGAHSYSHDPLAGSQPPPAGYGVHPHPGELERPVSRVSVLQTSPAGYPPPMQYADGSGPSTGIPSQHAPSAYAEPPRHYHTPAPFVAGHSHSHSHGQHGAHFALPPPPAGQAPVPIHEVFGQPMPASAPPLGAYGSYAGFPAAGGEQSGYEGVYEGGAHEGPFQTFQEQPYAVANAPPPPPPHLQQQLQYLPPPPVGGQMYYHQPGYGGAVSPQAAPGPGGANGSAGCVYGGGEYGAYQHGQNQVGNGYAPRSSIGMPGQAPFPPPPPLQQQQQPQQHQHLHHHHASYQHPHQQQQQSPHPMGYPVAYRAPAQVAYPQT